MPSTKWVPRSPKRKKPSTCSGTNICSCLNRSPASLPSRIETTSCCVTTRSFRTRFDPKPGDFCYHAYKGRSEKCERCPVEWTFADGKSYSTEETGVDKDGTIKHWIVRTSPIVNDKGEVVAAMEISHDISRTAATRSRSGTIGKEISRHIQQHTKSRVCTRHQDPHDPGL